MSATDELRRLLDEHGVEYETEDRQTNMQTYWGDWCFMEPLDAKPHTLGAQCELMCIPATPEQAIAATLGGNENRISERLHGVASDMRNIGASSMTPHELFAYWAREVDKAADLAATLCGRECEDVGTAAIFKCSMCGWQSSVFTFGEGMPCFCPQCGKVVKR